MDFSFTLCKFSPLKTPAINRSLGKKSVTDYVSETDSVTSVVTRDIHDIAKSVRRKLKETSDTDHLLSDTDFISPQSKAQDKQNKKMFNKKTVSSDSDMSSDSESDDEPPKVTPKKKLTAVNSSSKMKTQQNTNSKHLNGGKKTKSPEKQRDVDSSPSSSIDMSDSDSSSEDDKRETLKGGNLKQSLKRAHSFSSNSSSSLSSDESESVLKSPKKKIKTKHVEHTADISDNTDSDSDVSSVMDVNTFSEETVNTNAGSKNNRKGDSQSTFSDGRKHAKSDGVIGTSVSPVKGSKSPRKSASKNQYKIPDSFVVDTSQQCLTSKDIEGSKLWLIMAPDEVDISNFHRQNINMAGRSIINIETDEAETQYEVITQPYKDEVKTFNSVTRKGPEEQDYVVGDEIVGQIQVMNWIPDMPPVQITKTQPSKHRIPSDLKHKVQPFGSESPERQTEGLDSFSVGKSPKHKKKKKKKDRAPSPSILAEVNEDFVEKSHKHKKKKKKKDKS